MNQKRDPIGVFDSGVGGISTLQEMIRAVREGQTRPVVYLNEDDKPADFHITPLSLYKIDPSFRALPFDTLSEAAEYFSVPACRSSWISSNTPCGR